MSGDFVFVDECVPGVRWDAKYATCDNFTGQPLPGYLANRIVGTRALCTALTHARDHAGGCGFGLLLWDGYRPQRAVDFLLWWTEQPDDGSAKDRHHPNIDRAAMVTEGYLATRSGHSRGSTVDLTLVELATGVPVAMGGHHDLMDPVSHHGSPGITRSAARHRQLLSDVMQDAGFVPYQREWWHYTLANEPYPDTYFDFPVSTGTRSVLTPVAVR